MLGRTGGSRAGARAGVAALPGRAGDARVGTDGAARTACRSVSAGARTGRPAYGRRMLAAPWSFRDSDGRSRRRGCR